MQRPRSCKAFPAAVLCLAALALCPPSVAQEEDTHEPPQRTVLKAFKFADVTYLADLVQVVGVNVAVDPKRRIVVLRGPDSQLQTAIELIDALDTPEPPWGIELLVHLVVASREPMDSPDLPANLESALAELSELVGYHGFEVVDTIVLHATTDAGSAEVRGPVRDGAIFDVGFDRATVVYGEPKNSVLFENLSISAPAEDIRLRTNVKVPEGHTVLIGKGSIRGTEGNKDLVMAIEIRLTLPRDKDD